MENHGVMDKNIWTVPNGITSFRIIAGPICILLILSGTAWAMWSCLFVMALAELSDFLDGYIARAYDQVSDLGKILDPMSDSIYRISVFVAFVSQGWMPVWMFLLILCRDIIVSYLRILAEQQIGTLAARSSGKWKAIVQSGAQIIVVSLHALYGTTISGLAEQVAFYSLLAATLVTAYSLIDYGTSVIMRLPRGNGK